MSEHSALPLLPSRRPKQPPGRGRRAGPAAGAITQPVLSYFSHVHNPFLNSDCFVFRETHRSWSNPDIDPVGFFLEPDEANGADGADGKAEADCRPWPSSQKSSVPLEAGLDEIHHCSSVSDLTRCVHTSKSQSNFGLMSHMHSVLLRP